MYVVYHDAVSVETLKNTLKAWSEDATGGALRLVFTNSCNSAYLAQVLSEYVDFVIGHHEPVLDAAVDFAESLYKALGAGRSLLNSFALAKGVKDCSMYCLRGRKDANQFAFVKPTPDLAVVLHEVAPPAAASMKPAILPSPDEPPGTSTVDARDDETSVDRGKTCRVCGFRPGQCVCPTASSKVNANASANAIGSEEGVHKITE